MIAVKILKTYIVLVLFMLKLGISSWNVIKINPSLAYFMLFRHFENISFELIDFSFHFSVSEFVMR